MRLTRFDTQTGCLYNHSCLESNAISSDYVRLMRIRLKSLIITAGTSLLLAGCCTAGHYTKWEYKVADLPTPPRAARRGRRSGKAS